MYNPRNAAMTNYGNTWRMRLLAVFGWALDIRFQVDGLPFGGTYRAPHPNQINARSGLGELHTYASSAGRPVIGYVESDNGT